MSLLTANAARVVQELAPGAIVTLFEIDVSAADPSEPPFHFHSGTNDVGGSIVYNGATYRYFPIESEGWERNADGPLARPKLRCSNVGGDLGRVVRSLGDLIGCRVRRIEIPARYLDAVNFPNGNPLADPEATVLVEEYWVERKPTQTPTTLEFELSSVLEVEGQQMPARQVVGNCCMWRRYRGDGCGYTGTLYFNARNQPVASADEDVCAKNMKACDLRHTRPVSVNTVEAPKYADYVNMVQANGRFLDRAMTPDPTISPVWPTGWRALGGRNVFRATQCRRGTVNKVMPTLDLHFAGDVGPGQVCLLTFLDRAVDTSAAQSLWLGAWLQTVEGSFPADVSIWLCAFGANSPAGAPIGPVKLCEIPPAQLKDWAFHQGQVSVPDKLRQMNSDDETYANYTNFGLYMEFPDAYTPKTDGDGEVTQGGKTLDFWIRVGLPAVLPSATPALTVVPQAVTKTQYVKDPLPFGGFPGASLTQS